MGTMGWIILTVVGFVGALLCLGKLIEPVLRR